MAKIGLLDRMIGAMSPQRALNRVRAKTALKHATMYFEGAAKTNRTRNWRNKGTDANAAASGQLPRLRNVSRDLVRNNSLAARGKSVVVNAIVGTGIIPGVTAPTPKRKVQIDGFIIKHLDTTAIDADGRHDLYGLQACAVAAMFESGEVLLRRRYRFAVDGWPLPFQIQALEADFLDDSKTGVQTNGNIAIQGVEFDLIGRRVAYWIFDNHPGSLASVPGGYISKRVDARDIIHLYRVDRPGQVRGIPWLAPVVVTLQDFADFKDAQLVRQKIAACFAAFITDPDYEGDAPPTNAEGSEEGWRPPFEEIGPGMIESLPFGKEVTFSNPPQVGEFSNYADATARDIAVGIGITVESLTGNLSGVNFASGRMGRLDMDANVEAWRWLTVIPQMCRGIERWFTDGVAAASFSTEPFTMGWTPPRRPLVDPGKELGAMADAVRNGFMSRSAQIRELGLDPETVNAEIAADNKFADDSGFVFDTDPRRVTQSGQGQQPSASEE